MYACMLEKTGRSGSSSAAGGRHYTDWVKTFQYGCFGELTFLSVTLHPWSVSKPNKLIDSPELTLIKSKLSLSFPMLSRKI